MIIQYIAHTLVIIYHKSNNFLLFDYSTTTPLENIIQVKASQHTDEHIKKQSRVKKPGFQIIKRTSLKV